MDINVGMIIVITIAFVALVIINRKKAKISGAVGETKVSILLKLLGKDYSLLNDIMLDTNYGTTQIDHIVVSPYGIFVIETKNYQGWILGGENSEYWTQNMYGNKYQFRNPLLQNNAHVNVLRKILPYYANDNFVSIVAFSGKSTLKVNVSEACHVLYISKLLWFIKKYKEVKLNPCQIEEICNLINDNNISSSEVKKNMRNW